MCAQKYTTMSCEGIGAVAAEKIEDIVFLEMKNKLSEFSELTMKEKPESTLELTKLKVRVTQIEQEIDTLITKVLEANKTTMEYINKKIEQLDSEKEETKKKIAELSADLYGRKNVGTIKNYMDMWDEISISDKITVVDSLIDTIRVDKENVEISWKI